MECCNFSLGCLQSNQNYLALCGVQVRFINTSIHQVSPKWYVNSHIFLYFSLNPACVGPQQTLKKTSINKIPFTKILETFYISKVWRSLSYNVRFKILKCYLDDCTKLHLDFKIQFSFLYCKMGWLRKIICSVTSPSKGTQQNSLQI